VAKVRPSSRSKVDTSLVRDATTSAPITSSPSRSEATMASAAPRSASMAAISGLRVPRGATRVGRSPPAASSSEAGSSAAVRHTGPGLAPAPAGPAVGGSASLFTTDAPSARWSAGRSSAGRVNTWERIVGAWPELANRMISARSARSISQVCTNIASRISDGSWASLTMRVKANSEVMLS
jgi:hypothetical protein